MGDEKTYRTYAYIDGFNLFYGALKGHPEYKWLDLQALLSSIIDPRYKIDLIRYFTARVKATLSDPSKNTRQDIYLQALRAHIPHVKTHFGQFLSNTKFMPLADPTAEPRFVEVIASEEKGTDVNLAVHMVNDAWRDRYDCAILVTNDSDLVEAVKIVKEQKKIIGLIKPRNRRSKKLEVHCNFHRYITPTHIKNSQLPGTIPGANLHRPAEWSI